MRRFLLTMALAMLALSAGAQTVQQTAPSSLKAQGNEPGWQLTITPRTLVLVTDYGNRRVERARRATVRQENGWTYVAGRGKSAIRATVTNQLCRDDMSGMPYPLTVTVADGARRLSSGCGGEPSALLQGKIWVVEDINRGGIIDSSRVTLAFGADGSLVGLGSCNQYSSRYTLNGEGLSVNAPASTRKACAPALMQQESRFLDTLQNTRRFDIDASGALLLLTDDERQLKARAE